MSHQSPESLLRASLKGPRVLGGSSMPRKCPLAKQTHASFVDSLMMRAHISSLDSQYEQTRVSLNFQNHQKLVAETASPIEVEDQRIVLTERQTTDRQEHESQTNQHGDPSLQSQPNSLINIDGKTGVTATVARYGQAVHIKHNQTSFEQPVDSIDSRVDDPLMASSLVASSRDNNPQPALVSSQAQNETRKHSIETGMGAIMIDQSDPLQTATITSGTLSNKEGEKTNTTSRKTLIKNDSFNATVMHAHTSPMVSRLVQLDDKGTGIAENTPSSSFKAYSPKQTAKATSLYVATQVQTTVTASNQTSGHVTIVAAGINAGGAITSAFGQGRPLHPQQHHSILNVVPLSEFTLQAQAAPQHARSATRKAVISVTGQAPEPATKVPSQLAAPKEELLDSLITRTVNKTKTNGGVLVQATHQQKKLMQNQTLFVNGQGSVRRHTLQSQAVQNNQVINTDLSQVVEASPLKETGGKETAQSFKRRKEGSKMNANMQTLTEGGSSMDEEQRTLTPNSQLFIFQGKFDSRKATRGEGLTPQTLAQDQATEVDLEIGTRLGSVMNAASCNSSKRREVKVTAINVGTKSNNLRLTQVETELGTHRLQSNQSPASNVGEACARTTYRTKEVESPPQQHPKGGKMSNCSEKYQKKDRGSVYKENRQVAGALLRQSQSGAISPSKGTQAEKLEVQEGASPIYRKKASRVSQFDNQDPQKTPAREQLQKNSESKSGKLVPQKCIDSRLQSEPRVQSSEHHEGSGDEQSRGPTIDAISNERPKLALAEGLSEQERLEIKHAMKFVYPDLAAAQTSRRKAQQRQSKTVRDKNRIGDQKSVGKVAHVLCTAPDEITQGRAFVSRVSKRPLMNQGFLAAAARSQLPVSSTKSTRHKSRGAGSVQYYDAVSHLQSTTAQRRQFLHSGGAAERSQWASSYEAATVLSGGDDLLSCNSGGLQFVTSPKRKGIALSQTCAGGLPQTNVPMASAIPYKQQNKGAQRIDLPAIQRFSTTQGSAAHGRDKNDQNASLTQSVMYGENEVAVDLNLLAASQKLNQLDQSQRQSTIEQQQKPASRIVPSRGSQGHSSGRPAYQLGVLKQEQFAFQQIDEQRVADRQLQETSSNTVAFLNKKKPFASRRSEFESGQPRQMEFLGNSEFRKKSSDQSHEQQSKCSSVKRVPDRDIRSSSPLKSGGSPTKLLKSVGETDSLGSQKDSQVQGSTPPLLLTARDTHQVAGGRAARTSYQGKRDNSAYTKDLPPQVAPQSVDSNGNQRPDSHCNVVSSGEVSLVQPHLLAGAPMESSPRHGNQVQEVFSGAVAGALGSIKRQSLPNAFSQVSAQAQAKLQQRKDHHKPSRLQTQHLYIKNMHEGHRKKSPNFQGGEEVESPQTIAAQHAFPSKGAFSPVKLVTSRMSESQLTNMSTEGYIRRPLLAQSNNLHGQQQASPSMRNPSPEIWKPNMRTIVEGAGSQASPPPDMIGQQPSDRRKMAQAATLTMELLPTDQAHSPVTTREANGPASPLVPLNFKNQSQLATQQHEQLDEMTRGRLAGHQDTVSQPLLSKNEVGQEEDKQDQACSKQILLSDVAGTNVSSVREFRPSAKDDDHENGTGLLESKQTNYLTRQVYVKSRQSKATKTSRLQGSLTLDQKSQVVLNKDLAHHQSQEPAGKPQPSPKIGPIIVTQTGTSPSLFTMPMRGEGVSPRHQLKANKVQEPTSPSSLLVTRNNTEGLPFSIQGQSLSIHVQNSAESQTKKGPPHARQNPALGKKQKSLQDQASQSDGAQGGSAPVIEQIITSLGDLQDRAREKAAQEGLQIDQSSPKEKQQPPFLAISQQADQQPVYGSDGDPPTMTSRPVAAGSGSAQQFPKVMSMVSPRVQINRNEKLKEQWQALKVSGQGTSVQKNQGSSSENPNADLQSQMVGTSSEQLDSYDWVEKPKLSHLLAYEQEELAKNQAIGDVHETRPHLRLIKSQHVEEHMVAVAQRQGAVSNKAEHEAPIEAPLELHSKPSCSLLKIQDRIRTKRTDKQGSNIDSQGLTFSALPRQGYRTARTGSQKTRNCSSFIGASHLGATSDSPAYAVSPNGQRKHLKLASLERLKVFQRSVEQSGHTERHAYAKPECEYVLACTAETLKENLARQYGLQPHAQPDGSLGSPEYNSFFARQQAEAHSFKQRPQGFEFKRVPISKRAQGHLMMTDVASPDESRFAKRKLLAKQRQGHALHVQSQVQAKRLELSYHVSSPAAKMRSLIEIQQRKRNAFAKPSESANPVLYEDMSPMKMWRTFDSGTY